MFLLCTRTRTRARSRARAAARHPATAYAPARGRAGTGDGTPRPAPPSCDPAPAASVAWAAAAGTTDARRRRATRGGCRRAARLSVGKHGADPKMGRKKKPKVSVSDTDAGSGSPTNPIAVFTTNMGSFRAEIFLDRVPRTASNFIALAQSGFYDGLHFHRVIPGFMNQFGCPHSRDPHSERSGTGGPADGSSFRNLRTGEMERRFNGGNILDENIDRTSNREGTLSMANTGDQNTGGSQFFLNVANNANLDWFEPGESKHPVFGQLVDKKSFNVCVKISRVATRDDCPIKPVQVLSVAIDMRGSANLASPSDTANSATYFYLDKSQQEQGPFQLAEMRSWFSSGHLPASLRVREADDTDFRALEKHAALVAPLEQAGNRCAATAKAGGKIAGSTMGTARYTPY
jgi:cyclophilin family peptidyl-prolyl cis-trans isomerase